MFDIILYIVMVILSIGFVYPMWNVIVASISSPAYAQSLGLKILPDTFNLAAYKMVFMDDRIFVAYKNTIIRAILGVALTIPVTIFAGYSMTKRMPGRNALLIFLMITMFFTGGLIPNYILIINLGLLDTRWALVLPSLASAWYIIIAKNFIASLPKSLEESAFIDGAHPLRVIFSIIVPLSMPLISILTLWTAVYHWNEWFGAMIYTRDKSKLVLQLLLRKMIIEEDPTMLGDGMGLIGITDTTAPETIKAATILVSTVPILLFYPFLQKYFVKGVLIGSVKG